MAFNIEKRRKISVDIAPDVEKLLEQAKKEGGMSYTNTINELIRAALGLKPELRRSLSEFLESEYQKAGSQTHLPGSFAYEDQRETLIQLDRLYSLLNQNASIDERPAPQQVDMQSIAIKGGTLTVPRDWIRIEWDKPADSPYAGVVETRNDIKYDIPHFFFTSKKEISELTDFEEDAILKCCCEEYPAFREVLDRQVTPVYEDGRMTNLKEYRQAPEPGVFAIPFDGSRGDDERDYPYGAKIVDR